MHYNYLIIGGGIAGVTAAETIRERDPGGTIAVLSQEAHSLYSRVLLPNYVKGRIRRDQVFMRTADDFAKKKIELFLNKEAAFLDASKREVRSRGGEVYSFDKLLIASGGTPRPLNIPGENKKGIFRLQTIDDADKIVEFLPKSKQALVIGGGFISLEFLEITYVHNIPTTLVCRDQRFFGDALDIVGGEMMKRNFEAHDIKLVFGDEVEVFGGGETVSGVRTKKERVFDGDFVGIGVGLHHNVDIAIGTAIEARLDLGIRTDEFLETSAPGVFAAGDAAEYFDAILQRHHTHGNWTNAFLQGKIAGQNMAGKEKIPFRHIPFYSITNLGLHITFLGEVEENNGVEAISRADQDSRRYERFFLKDGVLIGAVLINMFQDKTILSELIERRVLIGNFRDKLADMTFDVKALLTIR